MRTHRLVRRIAAVSIMVASAALPAGVAHSADNSEAPVVTSRTANLVDMVDTSSRPVTNDLGLPTKPIAVVHIKTTPAVTTMPQVPVAPAVPAPAADTPKPATAKTTAKVATSPAKKTTTTTTKTTTKTVAAPAAPAPAAVAPAATAGSVTARQDLAGAVAAATNAQRAAAGLKPLAYRSCSVPASWAVHMASAGSLTHNSMMTVLTSCGGTTTAGENIAAGYTSVGAVTSGWMNSPGHKANILNPSFKIISVGVAQAANGTYYWVEDFTG
jgi:uncharacterized protein YkwD